MAFGVCSQGSFGWRHFCVMVDFDALNWAGPSGLRDRLAVLIDPRQRRGIRFPLEEILLLAMAAVLAASGRISPSATGLMI